MILEKNTPIYFQDFMSSEDMRRKYWEQSVNFKSNFSQFEPNKGHKAIAKIIKSKDNGHWLLKMLIIYIKQRV